MKSRADIVVVGGGHNGLTAAALLARAGLKVTVLERLGHVGGAAISTQPFAPHPARLSRYSYLVSLMPRELIADLNLNLDLKPRAVSSYTPYLSGLSDLGAKPGGLFIERTHTEATRQSFRDLTGSHDEYDAWLRFYADVERFAQAIGPTMLRPLPYASEIRDQVGADLWREFVTRPLGEVIEARFTNDVVRGVVATDAVVGTFTSLHNPKLIQNRCFLAHQVGNGTGEWRVPVGGMGAVSDALAARAMSYDVDLRLSSEVTTVETTGDGATVRYRDGAGQEASVKARLVLSNLAPWRTTQLLGLPPRMRKPQGAQLKLNFLLARLPKLKTGIDPRLAFTGTFHVGESYAQLEAAHAAASRGEVPETIPGEMYCHSLTDPSILGPLAATGAHTLTYFGMHTPPSIFEPDPEARRELVVERALATINSCLAEPIESCLMLDGAGELCMEAKIPQDIEAELGMPGGHIFHQDLDWAWADQGADLSTPAARWGVSTEDPSVLICGAGSRRGAFVSGIGGHNAAQAALELLG